jgi:methylated-DNA-[protein]-cysteine S-methyltransferase
MNEEVFSKTVKEVVRGIPLGSVLTYKEVAIRAGRPAAYRAVANIMARNFDPAIPCHRVIRSDGTLGGYNRGGTHQKRTLLQAEGVILM